MLDLNVSGGVARMTLCRAPVNAINDELLSGFHVALDTLEKRSDWNVLIIESSLKVFCAGADLTQIDGCISQADGAERMVKIISQFQSLFRRLETLPAVTFAVIGGAALGGGLELALACDLRIAAQEAKLGLPEANLGVIPGAGGTQRLTQLCGRGVASRLIMGAEILDGNAALTLGLVQWSVPRADLQVQAQEIASRIAALSSSAIAESKRCIAAAQKWDGLGYGMEIEATRRLYQDADTQKRIRTFLDKTKK